MATSSFGHAPRKRVKAKADTREPVFLSGDRAASYPKPDGQLNHIRLQRHVPVELATAWVRMCPAQVYEIDDDAPQNGAVTVKINPSNCVQCGAITAKGGRLTPPEGGDGPVYQIT